jgi:aspartyl aminopeptidase
MGESTHPGYSTAAAHVSKADIGKGRVLARRKAQRRAATDESYIGLITMITFPLLGR